jgi:hypothetical protein
LTYALHKPARHVYARNQTIVGDKDDQWQADLAIMSNIANENDHNQYILTCVDVLSRYAWAVPVRTKSAHDMLAAMKQLFKQAAPRKPKRLQTDKGREFYNSDVKDFLSARGVHLFSSESDNKAALVERFNRTLKTMLYRYFTAWNTRRWVNILQDAVYAYNHRTNRTIGCPPADVETDADVNRVWKRVYYDSKEARLRRADEQRRTKRRMEDHAKDDRVRLSRWKGEFEKGYMPNWGREHYVVTATSAPQRGVQRRPVYKIADEQGEEIKGVCYPEELQRVPPGNVRDVLEVDRVIKKRRTAQGTSETLVKFRGWPDKFNRWLTDQELERHTSAPRDQQQSG